MYAAAPSNKMTTFTSRLFWFLLSWSCLISLGYNEPNFYSSEILDKNSKLYQEQKKVHTINDIQFYLYTRKNPDVPDQIFTNSSKISNNFNPNNPTKILAHGWNDNYQGGFVQRTKSAFLEKGDYNIIGINWSKLGSSLVYYPSAKNTAEVGNFTAQLINFLVEKTAINLKNIHLIGFSLGGHVVGFAGKYLKNGKVARITGLDPAMPLFANNDESSRISKGDAEFVDIIHTSAGFQGFMKPLGDGDFYPNGGTHPQPGCLIADTGCSHGRSVTYYIQTISDPKRYPTKECLDIEEVRNGTCTVQANVTPPMGDGAFKKANGLPGIYYTDTTVN